VYLDDWMQQTLSNHRSEESKLVRQFHLQLVEVVDEEGRNPDDAN